MPLGPLCFGRFLLSEKLSYLTRAGSTASVPQVAKWKSALDAQLERASQRRPKRLLVFINPFGGAGRAQKVFAGKVHTYTY